MGTWLGEELKRLRQARGLTIRDLARAARLAHMTYANYEWGKAVPPARGRPRLAEALGTTEQGLDDLIEEDEYEVFLRSRSLSDAGKEAIRDFLKKVREEDRAEEDRP